MRRRLKPRDDLVRANRSPRQVQSKRLDGVARLDDLLSSSGNRLEQLKGQRAERHSIRVNAQYRVTFRGENGHAYEVCVKDYH